MTAWANLNPRASPQQADVIVYLGHRPNRRTRVVTQRTLDDGNRRRQSRHTFHRRTLDRTHKLARIHRQRVQKTTPRFHIKRVKRQRALPRTAGPRHHDKGVLGNIKRHVIKIVFRGVLNVNDIDWFAGSTHGSLRSRRHFSAAQSKKWSVKFAHPSLHAAYGFSGTISGNARQWPDATASEKNGSSRRENAP